MLNVTYGLNIYSADDPLLARFVSAVYHAVLRTTLPGAYLVVGYCLIVPYSSITTSQNIVPALRFLPSWFPGASFKKYAKYWADETRDLIHGAFNRARKSIVIPLYCMELIIVLRFISRKKDVLLLRSFRKPLKMFHRRNCLGKLEIQSCTLL